MIGWLVGWLFNGTSTQKGQFVPTVGEGNWLSRQRDTMHTTLRHTTTMQHNPQLNTPVTQTQQPVIQSNDLLAYY